MAKGWLGKADTNAGGYLGKPAPWVGDGQIKQIRRKMVTRLTRVEDRCMLG